MDPASQQLTIAECIIFDPFSEADWGTHLNLHREGYRDRPDLLTVS
jgi:hypothetical protein